MSSPGKRPPSWRESWIIEDANEEDHRAKRKKEAKRLEGEIDSGDYDSNTFQEIIQLLDHECLCYEPRSCNPPDSVLKVNWTSTILNKLSECLVRAISPSSYFECELQSRALISTLALLRAQDVNAFEVRQYDSLFNQYKSRYQDLQKLGSGSRNGRFTREKFRQFQTSYLLCSGVEYATHFKRAEPILITTLSRLADLFYVGTSATILAHTGSVAGSIPGTVRQLDNVLKPLWRRPNEKYEVLFILRELTGKAVAHHLVEKVKKMSDRIDENGKAIASAALEASLDVAAAILEKILVELEKYDRFETTTRPPSTFSKYLLTICDRGPPAMNTYFYLYGLLDCATQLGRILPYDRISAKFKSKMMTIICRSEEGSYRWKAVEFLLADTEIRTSQAQRIIEDLGTTTKECHEKVLNVIDVLSDCLDEEDRFPLHKKNNSSCSSQVSSVPFDTNTPAGVHKRNNSCFSSQVSSVSFDRNTLAKRSPQNWIEDPFDPPTKLNEAKALSISLGKGPYKSAGFSPKCTLAFLLSKNSISVYSLQSTPRFCQVPVKDGSLGGLEYREAILSERLLAIITKENLRVFHFMSPNASYREVGIKGFECCWDPQCLSLHEANDWAWISVGGRMNHNGVLNGSLKIYRVDLSGSGSAAIVSVVDLNSPSPNGLTKDFPKAMDFSPDGLRLACVTHKNRVLTWHLPNNEQPRCSPFQIKKRYTQETNARGVTSAHLFYSPSSRPYILSTTSPSNECYRNGGEWTYISPVSDTPSDDLKELSQDLWLRDAGAILTGAAAASGDIVALLKETGELLLFPLTPREGGGLAPANSQEPMKPNKKRGGLAFPNLQEPIKLVPKLSKQQKASMTSLRFCSKGTDRQLHLYAIDTKGTVIWTSFN